MIPSKSFQNIDFILMDVEGTTSDIKFVKDVLFPYSAKELPNFLTNNLHRPEVQACVSQTLKVSKSTFTKEELSVATEQLLQWIKLDVKHPALKTLQGLIWEKGYSSGDFLAHVYEDVLPAFENWHKMKKTLGIYSSGSVAAQKLFFKYSTAGNLLPYLSFHFDLAIGSKREALSYKSICEIIERPAARVLFLSDISEELDAARQSGMKTGQLVRPGSPPPAATSIHPFFRSFSDIQILFAAH